MSGLIIDEPRRPFWQELVLALVAATAAPIAYQVGKAIRQRVTRRRENSETDQD